MRSVSDKEPKSIEKIGATNYRFNYNIQTETVTDPDSKEKRTQYVFDTVDVYEPLTANSITQAVISDRWESNYEQKLVNEYNAAQLGIYDEETTKAKTELYKAFLEERKALKAYIDVECEKFGIK